MLNVVCAVVCFASVVVMWLLLRRFERAADADLKSRRADLAQSKGQLATYIQLVARNEELNRELIEELKPKPRAPRKPKKVEA